MKQTDKSCTQMSFPNWLDAINASNLNPQSRHAFAITIRWFLGYCKRTKQVACVDSIRGFLAWAKEEKSPDQRVFQSWRKALAWFYKNAPEAKGDMDSSEQLKEPETEWEKKLVNQMRIEHKALDTERSYRDWCRRMVRFCFDKKPEALGNADIERFLDNLATEGRVSAATQRQALNTLVYWFKMVRKVEVSEFLDYRKARPKKNLPVVMSQREIPLFLEQLSGTHQLMAKIQYGAGLRISDILYHFRIEMTKWCSSIRKQRKARLSDCI